MPRGNNTAGLSSKAAMRIIMFFWSVAIVLLIGWINNIINVIQGMRALEHLGDISGMLALQLAGVFVVPLGGLLGIISWFH